MSLKRKTIRWFIMMIKTIASILYYVFINYFVSFGVPYAIAVLSLRALNDSDDRQVSVVRSVINEKSGRDEPKKKLTAV